MQHSIHDLIDARNGRLLEDPSLLEDPTTGAPEIAADEHDELWTLLAVRKSDHIELPLDMDETLHMVPLAARYDAYTSVEGGFLPKHGVRIKASSMGQYRLVGRAEAVQQAMLAYGLAQRREHAYARQEFGGDAPGGSA